MVVAYGKGMPEGSEVAGQFASATLAPFPTLRPQDGRAYPASRRVEAARPDSAATFHFGQRCRIALWLAGFDRLNPCACLALR